VELHRRCDAATRISRGLKLEDTRRNHAIKTWHAKFEGAAAGKSTVSPCQPVLTCWKSGTWGQIAILPLPPGPQRISPAFLAK
jgi:hypothetical protein